MAVIVKLMITTWFQIILLSWLIFKANSVQSRSCMEERCGNVTMEYPFGMSKDCYFNKRFAVTCNKSSSGKEKAFLSGANNLELISIDSYVNSVLVYLPVISSCGNNMNLTEGNVVVDLSSTPFTISSRFNRFAAVGCNNYAVMKQNDSTISGCLSTCNKNERHHDHDTTTSVTCNGLNCCVTTIPENLKIFNASISHYNPSSCNHARDETQDCKYAFMATRLYGPSLYGVSIYQQDPNAFRHIVVPAVLEWGRTIGSCYEQIGPTTEVNGTSRPFIALGERHICACYNNKLSDAGQLCRGRLICLNIPNGDNCSSCPIGYNNTSGYYNTSSGLQCNNDKNYLIVDKKRIIIIAISCSVVVGLLLLLIGAWWLYKFLKRKKEIKLKQKIFKRNGGLLLQQQTFSNIEGNIEKTKLFTSKELEKATDNYNPNRILGQGGQGTVFKGMLTDGRIVAVKKSKIMDESNVEQFINEVVILSQINHRNVVKLLGCCLETDVPLLVYEFIINGTLSQYIHDQYEEFPITWEMRVGIAIEIANALSYMHSAASIPIYHRDIKSSNILLDDKYRAKVSDFGTSRSIAIDQTHLTTQVQGTFGYLDPEYFQSGQFTDKSDVYSFGVVLVELLTGQKPIRLANSKEDRSLASYFVHALKENRLFEVLDARVVKEGGKEEITTFASIAKRCLQLNGKKRPTMREVATELVSIKTSNEIGSSILHPIGHQEIEYFDGEITKHFETNYSFTEFFSDCNDTSSLDIEPLVSKF